VCCLVLALSWPWFLALSWPCPALSCLVLSCRVQTKNISCILFCLALSCSWSVLFVSCLVAVSCLSPHLPLPLAGQVDIADHPTANESQEWGHSPNQVIILCMFTFLSVALSLTDHPLTTVSAFQISRRHWKKSLSALMSRRPPSILRAYMVKVCLQMTKQPRSQSQTQHTHHSTHPTSKQTHNDHNNSNTNFTHLGSPVLLFVSASACRLSTCLVACPLSRCRWVGSVCH
jgi:hypothetical protein